MVGYIMMTMGITTAILGAFFGKVAKYTGRPVLIGSSLAIYFMGLVLLLIWKPVPEKSYQLFLVTCVWSVAGGISAGQLYGTVQTKYYFTNIIELYAIF